MRNPMRSWLALALLALSLVLFVLFLPLPIVFGGEDRTFSLAALVSASIDPIPVGTGILVLLFVAWSTKRESRRGGFAALGRGMIAGAHAYLWASFAVTAFLLAAFFVTGGGRDSFSWIGTRERVGLIKLGGWIALALVVAAESLEGDGVAERQGLARRLPRDLVHALDAISAVGLVLFIAVLYLRIFTYQAAPLDPNADWEPVGFLAPSLKSVSGALVLWSLFLAAVLPWSVARVSRGRRAERGLGPQVGRLGLLLGALGAVVVGFVSLTARMSAGGEGDVTQLQAVVGQMLIPLLLGILVWGLGLLGGSRQRTDAPTVHRESMA